MKSVEFKEFIILLIFLSCFGNVERNAMYFNLQECVRITSSKHRQNCIFYYDNLRYRNK